MFGFYNNAQMVLHVQDHYWGRRPSSWLHINCWYGWFWWSFPQSRVHWKWYQLDSSKGLVNGRWIWSWISTNEWSGDSRNYNAWQRGFKSVTHAQACVAYVHWNGWSCKVIYRPSSSVAGQELAGSCYSAPSTSCKTNTNYLICTF